MPSSASNAGKATPALARRFSSPDPVAAFQRKLAKEGVVFRDLVDDIKKELASLLILHQQFQVANVSSILGFSDPSSFIRSFKKWFGKTPAQFRSGINIPQ